MTATVDSLDTFERLSSQIEEETVEATLQRIHEIEARRRVDAAEEAVALSRLDRVKAYQRDGHASMHGVLRSSLGWSEGECRQRMQLARLVVAFECAGESLYETSAPVANIAAIARAFANPRCGDQIGDVIGTMLTEAGRMEYDDFRRIPQRWEMLADNDGAHRDRSLAHENRNAHVVTFQGVTTLAGQWGDVDGPFVQEVFDKFVEAEFQVDWEQTVARHGEAACRALMPRSDAQRRADALTAIFRQAVSAAPGSRAPEPVVNISVDYRTWSDMMTIAKVFPERNVDPFDGDPRLVTDLRCETSTGELLDPHAVLQASLEAHVRFVMLDDEGVPIRWGRKRRLFSGAAREAVMTLGYRCSHPGCRVRAGRSQTDHLVEWHAGGETSPHNGGLSCSRHNRWKHRHGYTVHRDRHGHWHTYRADGTEIY